MNHDYKRTFSQIRPSEETVERILEMNKTKMKMRHWKGLLVAAICLISLLSATLVVNAATDGALVDGVRLILDGEDVNLFAYLKEHSTYIDEDGTECDQYVFEFEDGQGTHSTIVKEGATSVDTGTVFVAPEESDLPTEPTAQ